MVSDSFFYFIFFYVAIRQCFLSLSGALVKNISFRYPPFFLYLRHHLFLPRF